MLAFKEFREEYKKSLPKGKKFSVPEFNRAWTDYKSAENVKVSAPDLVVERQSSEVLQSNPILESANVVNQPIPTVPAEKALSVSKPPASVSNDVIDFSLEDLQDLADSLHQTIAGIIKTMSNSKIVIPDKQIGRLNKWGGRLLQKYDKNGWLQRYGLEIGYGATMLGVIGDAFFAYGIMQEAEKAKAEKKVEVPV